MFVITAAKQWIIYTKVVILQRNKVIVQFMQYSFIL